MADRRPTSFSDTNAAGRKYKSGGKRKEREPEREPARPRRKGTLANPLRPGDPGYERPSPRPTSRQSQSRSESRSEPRPTTRRSSADDAPLGAGMAERARQAQIADRARRQSKLDEIMRSMSHTDRKTMQQPGGMSNGGRVKK